MKIKTVLLALALISFADVILVACCDCDSEPAGLYKICDINIANLDNSDLQITVASDTVPKEAYALELNLNITTNEQCAKSMTLFSGAYATSCECAIDYYTDNPIVDLRVVSTNDINPNLPAGTDLSNYFYLFDGFEYIPSSTIIGNYVIDDYRTVITHQLRLMEYPEASGMQTFVVTIELEDGTVHSSQAPTIYLK
ncbi:DUF5034 domain-containing protein [Phaeocystidibacter marisrubri]|uniref:DUF5034 domain-containing protein n=1 Tax=Phaeocystidibacter marisrubri TaxID=1577780 RepID=A0A6L3ZL07_9FLAO|nr:DUF5034 domain-containing protein [Phaeocystidibacter marisrubri]KAB2817830.1 DUF5034 domain-containing protein [Phaeocystidibacter marisrubri]GGH73305.1 hypothetical protein GCM10011318_18200 [Phaeocystidibacter marisrubri]